MPNPGFLNLKNYSLSALAVGLACTLGGHPALANPGDFYTPPATASDPAVAGSNVSRMTALTGRNSFDCRTSAFPGDNRLAEMPNSTLAFHQSGSTPTQVDSGPSYCLNRPLKFAHERSFYGPCTDRLGSMHGIAL